VGERELVWIESRPKIVLALNDLSLKVAQISLS